MIRRAAPAAALALACLAAHAEERDPAARAEAEARALLGAVAGAERVEAAPEEPPGARAARAWVAAQARLRAGDDAGATALLLVALAAPEFRASLAWPEATWDLAEALRRQGLLASARARYGELLAAPGAAHAAEAAVRALSCSVALGRYGEADALLEAARRLSGGEAPAEALYLAGKAAWRRRDLPAAERSRRALELLARVGPPWELHAAYFRGALQVAAGDLGAALPAFERCGAAEPRDAGQAAVREECLLGAARVLAARGRHREAAELYARIPVASPRHAEATFEAAYAWLRAGRSDLALRHVALLADLEADSPLGPRAALLRGHLLLQAGRYDEAIASYDRVIDRYAPVRDEMDAVLSLGEDPVRYFDELVGRGGELDAAALLPPVAVKWAARRGEVDEALALVAGLDGARRELDEARLAADRLDALLSHGYGLGVRPDLEAASLRAEEAHTEAVRLEARLDDEELHLLPISPVRSEREAARAGRRQLQEAFARLPVTAAELAARRAGAAARVDRLLATLRQLEGEAAGIEAVAAGTQRWLEAHRGRLRGDEERPAMVEELRRHREVGAGLRAEVEALRRAANRERDVAGRGLSPAEEQVRHDLRRAVARDLEAMAPARAALDPGARERAARLDAVRARLAEVVARADRVKRGLLARARASAERLREEALRERRGLDEAAAALDGLQAEAKRQVGPVAERAFRDVRGSFYELVLQADVGIVDAAWSRKRERVERIQSLAARQAEDLSAVDAAGAGPGEGP